MTPRSFRPFAAVLLGLLPFLLRAETLEALLGPATDAEVRYLASRPPPDEPWEHHNFLVYAAADSQGGLTNPEVIAISQTFLAADPADALVLIQRADAWRQLGQFTRALADLDKVPAAEAGSAESQLLRAEILQGQGRLPGALAAAKAVQGGNDYYQGRAAELVALLERQRPAWEQALRPILAAPPANPDPALARTALDCGADNLAHDLARRVLATRPDDPTAREVLLAIYAKLELDTSYLTLAVHRVAAPLAAAQARAHPADTAAWRTAVDYAATVVPGAGPAGAAAFATLLREAKAAGGEYPRADALLALCQAPDAAALLRLGDQYYGLLADDFKLRKVYHERLLGFSPAQPALQAAQASPARGDLWTQFLATARAEIEAGRLPGVLYLDFLEQAAVAGHKFPAEQTRAKLFAADSNYDIIQTIRTVLPETRRQPDLEASIAAVARRFTDVPADSLGFNTALTAPAGTPPLFTEALIITPELRAGLEGLARGLPRGRTLFQLGAPGEALAELAHADAAATATAEYWLLRSRLLLLAGRPELAMLALDRARFLADKPLEIPDDERLDDIPTARFRSEILSACRQQAEEVGPLAERLARRPDEADSWGRLARLWSESPLACVPKALAAAARARQLDPRQPDALRAELNALGAQLRLVPTGMGGPFATLLVNRLDQFTDQDWLLRVALLRELPQDTRKTLAAQWLDQLRPKRDRIADGALIEQALRIYGIKSLGETEDILAKLGQLPDSHPLQFELKTARLVEEAFLRQRGWFIGEPEGLWDEEIDERNLTASLQKSVLSKLREEVLKTSGRELILNLQQLQAKVWELYETQRLHSHEGILPPKDWTGTPEEFRAKVITTGRFGPATATAAPTAGCVPYFPGLTSEERKLATHCIALLVETGVKLDQGRLTTLALELYRRQETRDRDLAAWQAQAAAISGGGDEHEYPEIPAALALANQQQYADAYARVRPLLERGVENYYLEVIAGGYANHERRYEEGMRHFARAKAFVGAVPALTKYADQCVAVVRQNLDNDRSNRRAAIQARLAYIDEFLGYLQRDAANSVAMAKNAVSGMEELQKSNVTYYNADSLQHQADKYGLMHDGARSRLQEIAKQAEELEAERKKLRQELSRL